MFSVYVLRSSKTGRRYVGSCADLSDRLRRHNGGESRATKRGLPWTLIYEEQFSRTEMKMNVIQRLSLGAILLGAVTTWAQQPANPDNTSAQAAKAQEATGEIPAASPTIAPIEPPSLIPPNSLPGPEAASLPLIPPAPELQQLLDLFKKSSLGKTADEHRLHVQMAALEAHIRNDEELHKLQRSAQEARTDLERRHRLRAYYELYYRKLRDRAETPELRDYLAAQAATHELTLLQPRVRHKTDEAEAARLAQARAGTSAAPLATPAQAKVNDVFHP